MYDKIIIDGIDYIIQNIEKELTVEDIANQFHFSKYYYNRMFKSVTGESVYSFIKRIRLDKSTYLLRYDIDKSITEISTKFGYSSSNYSTAFKKQYGQSPAEFKKSMSSSRVFMTENNYYADLTDKSFEYYDKKMKRVHLDDFEVIYNRYIGNYYEHNSYWVDFKSKYGLYIEEDSWLLDISYDDPMVTGEDRCISDICITTAKSIGDECNTMLIKGGEFMVYRFEGHAKYVFETFQGLLGIWMIGTKLNVDIQARKIMSRYIKIDGINKYLEVDIYIPIN